MDDICLNVGERGVLLGMTRTGKSTLAENIINHWSVKYPNCRVVVLDTKPRFRAQYELNGIPTKVSRRYRQWDWGEEIPGSVVIPLKEPRKELEWAWRHGYHIVIAQIHKRSEILTLDAVVQAAYEDRKKNVPLFFYFDELNNFFRARTPKATEGIIMTITSGGERSIGWLGAAQRPRWISIEAMESMTKVYWFKTPFEDDVKHLRTMGVPETAVPPKAYYQFYFYDRLTEKEGYVTVPPLGKAK